LKQPTKTVVQCDFDGTVTLEDVSFLLLDAFATGDWRRLHDEYEKANMSVGRFNEDAFAMVKADRDTLLKVVRSEAKLRPAFPELVACCHHKAFRLVIVSNGLDFYIHETLKNIGQDDIEVHAARTRFHPEGLKVQYIGPDGDPMDADFKEAYVNLFLSEGYRVIYVGNGISDALPARRCHHIFATANLLDYCRRENIDCTPFTDFNDVVRGLETL